MSKGIVMQESGIAKQLTVDALRTSKQGGGSEDWLPVDETNLVELDIGGSGTYRASDYGAYGIAVARVSPKVGGGATSKVAQQPGFGNLHILSIQEGSKSVLLSARMVKVNQQGGGTCLWVPEDEVNLETKYVDHSGTYTARADGSYGYSQITVSGVDVEITKDDDGDDVAEITDGGETREEKLPSEIRIEREPYFVGPYGDRAYIGFDGLVVRAYTASGRLWENENHPNGIIPTSELIFPVTITDINAVVDAMATSDLLEWPVYYKAQGHVARITSGSPREYVLEGGTAGLAIYENVGQSRYFAIVASKNEFVAEHYYISIDGQKYVISQPKSHPYTYLGKTVHSVILSSMIRPEHGDYIDVTVNDFAMANYTDEAAWIVIYGAHENGGQPVPVQFARPYDGRVLEDEFKVEVVDIKPGGQGDD